MREGIFPECLGVVKESVRVREGGGRGEAAYQPLQPLDQVVGHDGVVSRVVQAGAAFGVGTAELAACSAHAGASALAQAAAVEWLPHVPRLFGLCVVKFSTC